MQLMQDWSLCRVYIKSNCLRAFDRRPSGVVRSRPVHETHQDHDNVLHATTERTTGSSYNHSYISSEQKNTTNSYSTIMEAMDQPLWDWEEHRNYL